MQRPMNRAALANVLQERQHKGEPASRRRVLVDQIDPLISQVRGEVVDAAFEERIFVSIVGIKGRAGNSRAIEHLLYGHRRVSALDRKLDKRFLEREACPADSSIHFLELRPTECPLAYKEGPIVR